MRGLSIKKWAEDDRPREKLINKGIESLSNAELIAILLGSGTKDLTAVELAKKILDSAHNNLNQLAKFDLKKFQSFKGVGEAKAVTLMASLEFGRRRKKSEIIDKKKITHSNDVFNIFQPLIGDLPHEEFWILLLNRANKIIDIKKVSQGGTAGTVTDIKMILKAALDNLSSGIILCHNHPSGNYQPSEADRNITNKLSESSRMMDINMLDHVIVADNSYFSFADEGIL